MRYALEIAYNGTNYHGWQVQPNAKTVQEEIEKHLSILCKEPISVMASGRTDTGVHCAQQFLHFDSSTIIKSHDHFLYKLNGMLPPDITVAGLRKVSPSFHARFDAEERYYIYRISNKKIVFGSDIHTIIYSKLDIEAMNMATKYLLGEHDFQSFSKVKTEVKTFFCTISEAIWIKKEDDLIEFHIRGNRFLRGMVRAIVGTLMEIGSGKEKPEHLLNVINARDRSKAGKSVQAKGLTLEKVSYPNSAFNINFEIVKAQNSDLPIVKELFIEYQQQLGISLCFQSFDAELESLPYPYNEPEGVILILKHQNKTIGVVALKKLEEGVCEMKRLYIQAQYQGYGQGKALALKLMETAKEMGYNIMKLDTLNRLTSAVNLYKNLEFQETEAYNYNPENDILYFQKSL